MNCVLKRDDYMELIDNAAATAKVTTDQIIELINTLKKGLSPDHASILSQIEELTALETIQSLDGMSRLLCGCCDCLAVSE